MAFISRSPLRILNRQRLVRQHGSLFAHLAQHLPASGPSGLRNVLCNIFRVFLAVTLVQRNQLQDVLHSFIILFSVVFAITITFTCAYVKGHQIQENLIYGLQFQPREP
ncbi:hypothetical protein BG000_008049 [Podila horticola]|nr:hypothetical protein BG000_008049 [Podila horticola]